MDTSVSCHFNKTIIETNIKFTLMKKIIGEKKLTEEKEISSLGFAVRKQGCVFRQETVSTSLIILPIMI